MAADDTLLLANVDRQPRRSVRLAIRSDGSVAGDVVAEYSADSTVGAVLRAVGMNPSSAMVGDVTAVSVMDTPAQDILTDGVEVAHTFLPLAPQQTNNATPDADSVFVMPASGFDCGNRVVVPRGDWVIQRAGTAGADRQSTWHIRVTPSASNRGSWHDASAQMELHRNGDDWVAVAPVYTEPSHRSSEIWRTPRPTRPEIPCTVEVPAVEMFAANRARLSWVAILAPLPIAVMMAVFYRPIFALFAALGPVMAVGRWFEDRHRFGRAATAHEQQVSSACAEVGRRRLKLANDIAHSCWAMHPPLSAQMAIAEQRSVALWRSRLSDPEALRVAVGVGSRLVEIETEHEGRSIDSRLAEAAGERLSVGGVPIDVDFATVAVIGVCGLQHQRRSLARSVVLQLVNRLGPSDVRLELFVDDAGPWDWAKWLPNELVVHGCRANSDTTFSDERISLVVVDGSHNDSTAAFVRWSAAQEDPARFIALVLADSESELPASCGRVISISQSQHQITLLKGDGTTEIAPIGISERSALRWARSLAPLSDPLSPSPPGEPLSMVDLVPSTPGAVERSWIDRSQTARTGLPIAIGLGLEGSPVIVDLVRDGPHALIAGTTGSGKSELLRTLVGSLAALYSPADVAFALFDLKGGGAFGPFVSLPHTAGLVTDLDPHMIERAVAGLRADFVEREILFQRLGVADYDAAKVADPTSPPRLVVAVDEFAVLAQEYPDVLSSLIDLAARGRSLGIHLVLATQRPAGVVDQKIRANTAIRIALRVEDAFDSIDVIGSDRATHISRENPGRSLVIVGGSAPKVADVFYTAAPYRTSASIDIRPFQLSGATARLRQPNQASGATCGTQLDRLTSAICQVQNVDPASPCWAEPLPAALSSQVLRSQLGADGFECGEVPLGFVDEVVERSVGIWRWSFNTGPLLVVGGSRDCVSAAALAAVELLSEPHGAHDVYVVSAAEPAPGGHIGGWVDPDDTMRVLRLLDLVEQHRPSLGTESELPWLVVVIDNFAELLAASGDRRSDEIVERLTRIARDAARSRVTLMIGAATSRDVPTRLAHHCSQRLVLALADPTAGLMLGLALGATKGLPPMRAIDAVSGLHVQLMEPVPPTVRKIGGARSLHNTRKSPAAVERTPQLVRIGDLPPASIDSDGLRVSFGVGLRTAQPVWWHGYPGELLIVCGRVGTEPGQVLEVIAQQARALDGLAVSWIDASTRCDHDSEASAAHRECLATPSRSELVLVDLGGTQGSQSLWLRLAALRDSQPHKAFAVALSPSAIAAPAASMLRNWPDATALLLDAEPADGTLFRVRIDLEETRKTPGSGHHIRAGNVTPVQVARPRTV